MLNPNFDGYKLSLAPIPTIKHQLVSSPRRVFPNDDQYSFLHAKLFSLQNHLVRDPWLAYSCYFVDEDWTIRNIRYDTNTGQLQTIASVFKIPKPATCDGDYNSTFCFVSEKLCVFSDGCGALRIIDTGDRYRNEEWKGVYSEAAFDSNVRFLIQDARFEVRNNVRHIHCLLLSVNQRTGDDGFEALFDWIRLEKAPEGNNWTKTHLKQLQCKSLPEFCAFEPKCNALLVASDRKCEFVFDVEHPIAPKVDQPAAEGDEGNKMEASPIKFTWNQSDEDVVVHFDIEKDSNENDVKIICNGVKIDIQYRKQSLLDAELFDRIDNDVTTWNLVCAETPLLLFEVYSDWYFCFRKTNCCR